MMLVKSRPRSTRDLVVIKLVHTAVWAFISACIMAIPVAALSGRFRLAASLSAVVLFECLVLAFNRCRCPLTDLASGYTEQRAANFDIYLPLWLARYNKTIFGALFALGEIVLLWKWLVSTR